MDSERFDSSTTLLQSVLDGMTYDEVARARGMTRTAVERRVKALVLELVRTVGIEGLNESRAVFVRKMRSHRQAIERALVRFEPTAKSNKVVGDVLLSDDDISNAMRRVRARTKTPERDVAMVWILLATGLRPLEVARLVVADYLNPDGSVRSESVVRADVALNGRSRVLYFTSAMACEAIDAYLFTRSQAASSSTSRESAWLAAYRGLDPKEGLFLTESGMQFHVSVVASKTGLRTLCQEVHYAYRKIFRRIGIRGLSALSVRRTVMARLQLRGATQRQIGELLGIRALRMPSRTGLALHQLMDGLV